MAYVNEKKLQLGIICIIIAFMKNNDYLLKWVIASVVVGVHMGIGVCAWEAVKPQEPVSIDTLTFVDLSTYAGNHEPMADEMPAPSENPPVAAEPPPPPKITPPEKPKPKSEQPKVAESPKIRVVERPDKPADFRQPEPKKVKSVEPDKKQPLPKSESEVSTKQAETKTISPVSSSVNGSENSTSSHVQNSKENRTSGGDKGGDDKPGNSNNRSDNHSNSNEIVDGGYVNVALPPYPRSALNNDEEGTVKLVVVVELDGRVSSVKVTQSSGSAALDNAAMRAARSTKYKLKSKNGEPIRTRFNTSFEFKLGG